MDWTFILNFLSEMAYLLIVLGLFLTFAVFKGRQAIMNVMFGLYLALLMTIQFPLFDEMLGGLESSGSIAVAKLVFFIVVTLMTTRLCYRVMPEEFYENRFESFGKKLLLASGATMLVMAFSFNVLPVTELMTASTPIQALFATEAYFFWWLLAPLVFLYVV